MKVCFAVFKDEGIDSTVYDHFGSAPTFIIVDAVNAETTSVANRDSQHAHGACNPLQAIGCKQVDAVVVGGIGVGALMKLNSQGIKVFRSTKGTIKENLNLFREQKLPELTAQNSCSGHQGGCGHH